MNIRLLLRHRSTSYPSYAISIETNGHPINLKILDTFQFIKYERGKPYHCEEYKNVIRGTYAFKPPAYYECHVILENLSDHPVTVNIKFEEH